MLPSDSGANSDHRRQEHELHRCCCTIVPPSTAAGNRQLAAFLKNSCWREKTRRNFDFGGGLFVVCLPLSGFDKGQAPENTVQHFTCFCAIVRCSICKMLVYGVFESIFALEGLPRVKHPKTPLQSFTCLSRQRTSFHCHGVVLKTCFY